MSTKNNKLCLALCVLSIFFACKSSEPVTEKSAESASTYTNGYSQAEMEKLYWARRDSAKMSFVQADVDFMTGMIGHHAQALIMSDLAPKNGANPEIQVLAARIINAQKDEIAIMQTWLRDRDQPVPEVRIEGLNLMIHGVGGGHGGMNHDHMKMEGMLTQEQLVELSEAKDGEFDRLFLAYMIQHHAGAVGMVTTLVNTDGAVQDEAAFKIASDINVDQITEIERMRLMLSRLPTSSTELD